MAKKKVTKKTTPVNPPEPVQVPSPEPPKPASEPESLPSIREATITVPVAEAKGTGYEYQAAASGRVKIGVHVDAQLGRELAPAFLKIREGLRASNAKLKNGRPVYNNVDTLKWLIEQVAN